MVKLFVWASLFVLSVGHYADGFHGALLNLDEEGYKGIYGRQWLKNRNVLQLLGVQPRGAALL
jgi:hypothetical protein